MLKYNNTILHLNAEYLCFSDINILIKQLQEIKQKYHNASKISLYQDAGYNNISSEFYITCLETEEEYKARIQEEQKIEEEKRNKELKELERLALKYKKHLI